jgi:proteasome beta subunit
MIRANLMLAMQAGLVVVPLFAGYDDRAGVGRIFKYDVTGGRYEESEYWATGSGGRDARATIKKRYRPGITADDALKVALGPCSTPRRRTWAPAGRTCCGASTRTSPR